MAVSSGSRPKQCSGTGTNPRSWCGKGGSEPEQQSAICCQPRGEVFLQHIRQYSPLTAIKLEQIYEEYGSTAGGYGATALIWLEARTDLFGYRILSELTDTDMQAFTYFQYMSTKQDALDQFIDMRDCYRTEQRQASIVGFRITHLALKAGQSTEWSEAI